MKKLFVSIDDIEEVLEIMEDLNKKEFLCGYFEIENKIFLDIKSEKGILLKEKSLRKVLDAPLGFYYHRDQETINSDDKIKVELKKVKKYWEINN